MYDEPNEDDLAEWERERAEQERQNYRDQTGKEPCPHCNGTGLDYSTESGGSCPHCIGGIRWE